MKRTLLFACLVIALAPGCGNKPSDTAQPELGNEPPPTTDAANAPEAPPPGAPVAVPEAAAASEGGGATAPTADLNQLTAQLRTWMMNNRTGPPKNFEDWIARAKIQVPPAPAGKKYVITPTMWVALVDK